MELDLLEAVMIMMAIEHYVDDIDKDSIEFSVMENIYNKINKMIDGDLNGCI